MNKFYKYLTKIGDKLGLARDTKDKTITDGLTHLFKGGFIHVLVVVVLIALFNLLVGVYATWITTVITTLVFAYLEYQQEKDMVEEDPNRKFGFSKNRLQDIFIYTAFGIFLSSVLTLLWVII